MLKHMVNTGLIVGVVYLSLLFVIKHPFAMALVSDAKSTDKTSNIENKPTVTLSAPVTKNQVHSKNELKQPINQTKALEVVGLKQRVNISSTKDVEALWVKFQAMAQLQNNVRWGQAPIKLYAYYTYFSDDFTQANLSIGYARKDLMLNSDLYRFSLPIGNKQAYKFDTDKGIASDTAWAAAYRYNNLLEEYELDSSGKIKSQKVFIYQ